MEYLNLHLQTSEEGILLVTVSREKALNALNRQTMDELRFLFGEDLPGRTEVRGVIITGAGEKAFVAGADIKEFLDMQGEEGKQMALRGQETFFLIERSAVPVVAAVNGFALGGGCELAMACHLRIAGERARFGQPEINLGIIPGYGGTQRLIQYVGKTKAMELLLTADLIDGQEALRLGLVNALVPAGEEVEAARQLLRKILPKAPVAIAKTIEAVNAFFEASTDGFEAEVAAFGATTQTSDFLEGASAFVEKRKPQFTGK